MRVIAVKAQKDNSILIDLMIDEEDKKIIKFLMGIKKVSKKAIAKFIEKALYEYIDEKLLEDVNKEIHAYRKEQKKVNKRMSKSIQKGMKDLKEGRVTKVKDLDKFFKEL